jgi:two-component system cell cycle sensor histidine kinase/response regulator CckA
MTSWILAAVLGTACLVLGLLLYRAHAHARAAAAQLRDHLARAPLAIIEWGPEWRIVRWEGEAERIFGYPAAEVLGRRLAEIGLVHPDDAAAVDAVGNQLTGGQHRIVVSKNRNVTRDGRTVYCEWYNSVAFDGAGHVASMLSFVVDVTAQRNAEEQLRRSQRLEAIGRLAGGVAHETNNQMSVVLGFASHVAKDGNLTLQQRADMEEIRQAAERVATVTRQLLAFSRQQLLKTETLDLGVEVRAAAALLGRLLGPDVRLVVDAPAAPLWIRADRTQISQILVNCGVNARDAMPRGGALTIKATRVTTMPRGRLGTAFGEAGIVLLSIRDTGVGIASDVAERIFDPFFTTKPVGEGTGLGLSVVEGIVAQSGGDVWLDGGAGRGATFTFGFAAVASPAVAVFPGPPGTPIPRGAGTILVVEDEPSVRAIMVRVLSEAGYAPLVAEHGAAALEVLRSADGGVRLVIADYAMPLMDGAMLAERLAVEWPAVPLLVVSGHPAELVVRAAGPLASAPFLQKPFPPERLLQRVRELIAAPALRAPPAGVS